ncbi:hypothetical protein RSO01_90470 [Reyranella soli]|uniref:Uncharacterized protein n=1 Tax=Reyranella soli TaxID=1230389 RepID=A0A512NSF3_9HYPH|nr:hypothetical protein RSO01_90470 [Reyranella soli]
MGLADVTSHEQRPECRHRATIDLVRPLNLNKVHWVECNPTWPANNLQRTRWCPATPASLVPNGA